MIINKQKYTCENPIKAIESCFKCLMALNCFPYSCEHVWGFLQKLIYKIKPIKNYKKVNSFVKEINQILNINTSNNVSAEIVAEPEINEE